MRLTGSVIFPIIFFVGSTLPTASSSDPRRARRDLPPIQGEHVVELGARCGLEEVVEVLLDPHGRASIWRGGVWTGSLLALSY